MYSSNILPLDASYYVLSKASISDGVLTINGGGSAFYSFNTRTLNTLPSSFRFSIIPKLSIDRYAPTLYVYIRTVTTEGAERFITLTPTVEADSTYTQIFEVDSGEYDLCTFEIASDEDIVIQLWELCPEAIDSNVEAELDGVKESLPNLLVDYNTLPLTVQQAESTIGLITFSLSNTTDLQGHLSIAYTASEDCVLTLRIKDAGITELYTPIKYTVLRGQGVISLPHSYLNRLAGMHSVYVTCQVSNGTLTIGTRGLLYTIDGSYLATREIDAGMEVDDITIRNTTAENSPDEIWIVGITAGEALVKSCDYSDATSFVPQFTLGKAKAAAIEFDGKFVIDTENSGDAYVLVTDEVPYVFWIDNTNTLLGQFGSSEDTRFRLDTDVTCVSACRGYKSELFPEQDQGLIVLYVKNGEAMYKSYSYTYSGVYEWQGPFKITLSQPVIDVNVHRLNDYRVGFTLTTASANRWYISERMYVSQAVRPEVIDPTYDTNAYLAVLPSSYNFNFLATTEVDSTRMYLLITFSQEVHRVDSLAEFLPSEFTGINVESVEMLTTKTIRVKLRSRLTSSASFTYSTGGEIKFLVTPYSMNKPLLTFSSSAIILPKTNSYVETMSANYDVVSASISMSGLEFIENSMSDTFNASYDAGGSVIMRRVTYTEQSASDTMSVQYKPSGLIDLIQVGTKPI